MQQDALSASTDSGSGGTNPASLDPDVAVPGPADDRGLPPDREVPERVFWLGVPAGENSFAPRQSGADAGQLRDAQPGARYSLKLRVRMILKSI